LTAAPSSVKINRQETRILAVDSALAPSAQPRLFSPRKSPTIARLYARDDALSAKQASALHSKVIEGAQNLFKREFRGQKITLTKLEGIARTINDDLDEHRRHFVDHNMNRAGLAKPSKQSFVCQTLLIHANGAPPEERFTLVAVAVSATRRGGLIHMSQSPLRWIAHASSRLYERTDKPISNSHLAIAKRIGQAYAPLNALMATLDDGEMLALPIASGLLIGPVSAGKRNTGTLDIVAGDSSAFYDRFDHLMSTPSIAFNLNGAVPHRTWLAKTFVGANRLGPAQNDYAEAFLKLEQTLSTPPIGALVAPALRTVCNPRPKAIAIAKADAAKILEALPELTAAIRRTRRPALATG
jgi:hypothetical protein